MLQPNILHIFLYIESVGAAEDAAGGEEVLIEFLSREEVDGGGA